MKVKNKSFTYSFRVFAIAWFLLFFLALNPCESEVAQGDEVSEYTLKASFIYNFIKFSNFDSDVSKINICVYKDIRVLNDFAPLEKRRAQSLPIAVKLINSQQDLSSCQILFISKISSSEEESLLKNSRNLGLLTIGESSTFISKGGVINFYEQDSKIRFLISKESLNHSKTKLSSKLLRIAEVI